MAYHVEGAEVLIVSILVLFLGTFLTNRIAFLHKYNIPDAVTGGLICSIVVALLYACFDLKITFAMRARDLLLLVFFSTIGLGAKFRMLLAGGKTLVILLAAAAVFLLLQDITGIGLVMLMDGHPGYGLLGGSISFAGGHGTAIAWGQVAEEAGLTAAKEIGIACATFGLIAGGIIGGPIAGRLINKHSLRDDGPDAPEAEDGAEARPADLRAILGTLLLLALCVELGDLVNRVLFSRGVMLPGFLTAMLVGIVITNLADVRKAPLSKSAIDMSGEVSLQIFLSMSLMSMDLVSLTKAAGPILLVLAAQMTLITVFAAFILFRLMGRDYDAAVICGGFVGMGMGATPVAIANMSAVTQKFGPSPKAFLVVPLVGAFFIDIANAIVIKLFLKLPMFQQAVGG